MLLLCTAPARPLTTPAVCGAVGGAAVVGGGRAGGGGGRAAAAEGAVAGLASVRAGQATSVSGGPEWIMFNHMYAGVGLMEVASTQNSNYGGCPRRAEQRF